MSTTSGNISTTTVLVYGVLVVVESSLSRECEDSPQALDQWMIGLVLTV